MRADRGSCCLPEAGLGIPFAPGVSAPARARLTPRPRTRPWSPPAATAAGEALSADIVDHAVDENAVRTTAAELAATRAGKAGDTLRTITSRLQAQVLTPLGERENPLGD
ncbi:hypothetical protein [Streptomyces griseoruber]|uniref:hypothetical protein n=1 Tax=Streptomyces griseoruber TaxID=1943 RepID=UPI00378EEB32